ncbi:MAG: type IV pilus twitching motility protein PilT [Epsilonproteobacteria bacterium]|nr:type IV pilus twitching motility protein PilT [Campylobacterota bacterium]
MENLKIAPFINALLKKNASDLHLVAGDKPSIRVDGSLIKLNYHELTGKEIEELCYPFLTQKQIDRLKTKGEIDGMFAFSEKARFRFNIYKTLGELSAALRLIPTKTPDLTDINAPDVFRELTKLHRGLVLVTGPTGSGKSTTLASMLHEINKTQKRHIVTIEDPVEFLHKPILSTISHREVENDTKDFYTGLKYVLRQDPDVILIGEMRDSETIAAALTAAETGHLVFATLHTNSAPKSINRIIDSFEAAEQSQIRAMLASSLKAVISQTLLPKIGGGRVAAWEIMINNDAIANLIREHKIHQIYSTMQLGQAQGMQTQTKNLINFINQGIIDVETAINYAYYPEELKRQLGLK